MGEGENMLGGWEARDLSVGDLILIHNTTQSIEKKMYCVWSSRKESMI